MKQSKEIQRYYELDNVSVPITPKIPEIDNVMESLKNRENKIKDISERWNKITDWIEENKLKIGIKYISLLY